MSGTPGGNELRRHMAGVAPPGERAQRRDAEVEGPGILAGRTKNDPLTAMLIAGSIGYGLGWLTALSRSPKHEPLPDYARKRA